MGSDKVKIKRFYFIDMENVHRDGLNGIEQLTQKDCVRIYYSNPLETIPIDLHAQMMASPARYEYIRVEVPIKNAADCMILFDLRDLARDHKKAEFIIISNDNDFDRPISEFKHRGINTLKRQTIAECEPEEKAADEKREAEVRKFIKDHFGDIAITGDRDEILEKTVAAVLRGKTKSQVNYNLLKIYDNQSVKLIYNELKPLIKDLPGK